VGRSENQHTLKEGSMIIGYVRVSTNGQTVENQRLAIYEAGYQPANWFEVNASSRKSLAYRRINELVELAQPGDTIVVAELSRLGRSVGQVAILVNDLVNKGVELHCLKERIRVGGGEALDLQTKVMVTMFSLFAEIERDLISERTKEGLTRAVSEGKTLGRPKGQGKSKIDERRSEVAEWVRLGVSQASIAKMLGVSPTAVAHFVKTRILGNSK
jgi:DNA invertase Pin-like site-specific DNA recombinase